MKPQWVIFDIGGVLFDYRSSMRNVARHLSVPDEHLMDSIFAHVGPGELGQVSFEDVWMDVLKKMEKHHEHERILEQFWDVKWWVKDTKKLIGELDNAKYHLALFTNNWAGMGQKTMHYAPHLRVAKKIFESSVIGLRKPDPAFYQHVEREIQVTGQHIYFIDDTRPNLVTAKARNWQTFLYEIKDDDGKTSNDLIRSALL